MTKEFIENLLVDYGVTFTSSVANELVSVIRKEEENIKQTIFDRIDDTDRTDGYTAIFAGKQIKAMINDVFKEYADDKI